MAEPERAFLTDENPCAAVAPAARKGRLIFCPHRLVGSVCDITVQDLGALGIRGLILDLDNTLVRWQKEEISPQVMEWLSSLKGAGIRLCILSNSIFGKRSERIAARLGCPNIRRARKPSIHGFVRALQALETPPEATAIIGDQMFTDIWGGNRAGVHTIMVRRIDAREFLYTRFVSRPPENLLLQWYRRAGHL